MKTDVTLTIRRRFVEQASSHCDRSLRIVMVGGGLRSGCENETVVSLPSAASLVGRNELNSSASRLTRRSAAPVSALVHSIVSRAPTGSLCADEALRLSDRVSKADHGATP